MKLVTERLVLRDFAQGDWSAVHAYQVKPQYSRYSNWTQRTEDEVKLDIEKHISQQNSQPRTDFQLALELKGDQRVVGCCYLRITDSLCREACIGYELDPQEWGKGYATEASRRLLILGFEDLGLHRIWSRVVAENLRSGRVLVRLGMRLEGRLRETEYIRDRWCDTLLYAILDHEWNSQ